MKTYIDKSTPAKLKIKVAIGVSMGMKMSATILMAMEE